MGVGVKEPGKATLTDIPEPHSYPIIEARTVQQTNDTQTESNEERYRQAAEATTPPRPKNARPNGNLGAGRVVSPAQLPPYAKAHFPGLANADNANRKAAALTSEKKHPPPFKPHREA